MNVLIEYGNKQQTDIVEQHVSKLIDYKSQYYENVRITSRYVSGNKFPET